MVVLYEKKNRRLATRTYCSRSATSQCLTSVVRSIECAGDRSRYQDANASHRADIAFFSTSVRDFPLVLCPLLLVPILIFRNGFTDMAALDPNQRETTSRNQFELLRDRTKVEGGRIGLMVLIATQELG